jgi:hypothetical protein
VTGVPVGIGQSYSVAPKVLCLGCPPSSRAPRHVGVFPACRSLPRSCFFAGIWSKLSTQFLCFFSAVAIEVEQQLARAVAPADSLTVAKTDFNIPIGRYVHRHTGRGIEAGLPQHFKDSGHRPAKYSRPAELKGHAYCDQVLKIIEAPAAAAASNRYARFYESNLCPVVQGLIRYPRVPDHLRGRKSVLHNFRSPNGASEYLPLWLSTPRFHAFVK